MKEIVVNKSEDGLRFSKFLKKYFSEMPESLLFKLFRKKYFEINGKKANGNELIKVGDRIDIFLSDETYEKFVSKDKYKASIVNYNVDSENIKSRIVYEDNNIIIYNKPEGMLSQADSENSESVNSILNDYVTCTDRLYKPSIVNRLDRNTSGLIIFAKTYIAAREISKMIRDGSIEKKYMAIVNGLVKKDSDELINLYKKDERLNLAEIIDYNENDLKNNWSKVVLKYRVVKRNEESTVLDINLITGKSHQIRAQLSYIGHPIICDKKYMDSDLYKDNVRKYNRNCQKLTCYNIKFSKFENKDLEYLSYKEFSIDSV